MRVSKDLLIISLILLAGFLLRLVVSPYFTHHADVAFWIFWAKEINRLGFHNFFELIGWSDYLPFYFYVLFILEKIIQLFNITGELIYKIPAILADTATALLIFFMARDFQLKHKLLLPFIYLFNPAIFANSAMWGQVDGIGAFLVTLCLYLFLKQRLILLGIAIAMSALFKPLYLLNIPIFLLAQFKYDNLKGFYPNFESIHNLFKLTILKKVTILSVSIIVSCFLITAPFAKDIFSVSGLIVERYSASLNQYPYAAVNAFNFWALLNKNFQPDNQLFLNISFHNWGLMIFSVILFFSLAVLFIKKITSNLQYFKLLSLVLAVTYLAIFTFATRAHERHMLTFFPFLAILSLENVNLGVSYLLGSVVYLSNLYFGIQYLYTNGRFVFDPSVIQLYSGAVVLICFSLIYELVILAKSKT